MMKLNKTKIIATLGPASSSKTMMSKLIVSGVDVFRVNFSHANHEEVTRIVSDIKTLRIKHNRHVTILGDLQGPKIRIGAVKVDYAVKKGDIISFKTGDQFIADKNEFYMGYSNFAKDVKVGEKILIDDGKLIFVVTRTDKKNTVHAKSILDGIIRSNKGVNLPNTVISLPALTNKDKEDAIFAISQKVDRIN